MKGKARDPERVLGRLKDFQRRSAEYVFRRFYTGPEPGDRFLVADEVGLGKTMVARGVIALAIEHLLDKVDRIDVVYICSNVTIASQNVHRLNVSDEQEFAMPTRLSLLPMHISAIRENRVNYVSLTPGTSFDPRSREGKDEERALIHFLLKGRLGVSPAGLRRLLQCRVGDDRWSWWTSRWKPGRIDKDIRDDFVESIAGDPEFHERIKSFCSRFNRKTPTGNPERLELVSELRFRLAEVSIEALEPDLIILDEFQRFRNLLDPHSLEARLAQKLFRYREAKTLLLSATPYKMLSLDHERDDDHYADFLKTLEFLFDSASVTKDIKKDIQAFRQALYGLGSDVVVGAASRARNVLQSKLLRVMCRTERTGTGASRDVMLSESREETAIEPRDLHGAALADRVASSVGARDVIEYWKSSPYLVNFLRRYEFRRKLEARCEDPPGDLIEALRSGGDNLLRGKDIQSYKEVFPPNPRMRSLFDMTVNRGLWKILWLPPSMPYSRPGGSYADIGDVTKSLVFSAWNVVPDAIASLCSYEAERRMLSGLSKPVTHDRLYDELHSLLRYSRSSENRLTGMPVLILMYPSPALAALVDPLSIAVSCQDDELISAADFLNSAAELIRPSLDQLLADAPASGPEDQRWYWAAPALLDGKRFPNMKDWLLNDKKGWLSIAKEGLGGRVEGLREHLELFRKIMDPTIDSSLGRPPVDLLQVLSLMAVSAPGVCALRALRRQSPSLNLNSSELLCGAVRISEGFRTLFNLPESIALLRANEPETFYWRLALRHCLEGNIQSLLDEQAHCLVESLGVADEPEAERARAVGDSIGSSLSVRTSQLSVDEVSVRSRKIDLEPYNTRCRFALRFGELKDERGATVARADAVRDAFNSPFRPFVLASTSIGQEGLDFHTWCHSVVHWNLPRNPVDLEQREGRIQRYKGHAVRKNIAGAYGLGALRGGWDKGSEPDPWRFMFELARVQRPVDANDLVPYWIFELEGGASVIRHVPVLPCSREGPHFRDLKKMLAVYRLVFGQPRQEDLLEYLTGRAGGKHGYRDFDMWRISLEPPVP